MITLHELIGISEDDFCNYKVHFAIGRDKRKEPYNTFLIGDFKVFQERQTEKNWSRKYILSLIYYEKDIWMFGIIYPSLPYTLITISASNVLLT